MNVFEVSSINFSYDEKRIFNNASMELSKGSVVGVLGPNGSGKTTFFDILCGLRTVESGVVTAYYSDQLYLSQILTTPPVLRMKDIFKMVACFSSRKQTTTHQAIEKFRAWSPPIASRFEELLTKKSSLCSYGEKRWFFTLTILSMDADFIILDEPTAGVDPEFRFHIWQCLRAAAEDGAAILASSHHIEEIVQICDSFYTISDKKFLKFDSGREYMDRYEAKTLDEAFIRSVQV